MHADQMANISEAENNQDHERLHKPIDRPEKLHTQRPQNQTVQLSEPVPIG